MLVSRCVLLAILAVALGMAQTSALTIVTPPQLLPAAAGLQYSASLAASGGSPPYLWSLSPTPANNNLPSGMTLSSRGGLEGVPGAAGTFTFNLIVTDNNSTAISQTFSLTVVSVGSLNRSGVLAHVAAGGWWDTTITLVNTSATTVGVSILFRSDDGAPLSLPVTLTQRGITQTSTSTSVSAALQPNSIALIGTGSLANNAVGWAEVLSSGKVSGFAVLRSTPTNDKPSEATVTLQASTLPTMTLAYDHVGGYALGVALTNLATGTASVDALIWDENGVYLGAQQISIPANGHTSFVLGERIPSTAGKRGTIQFQNTVGVSGLALRFSPAGPFTTVPVMSQ